MKTSFTSLIICAMFLSVSYTAQAQIAVESPIKQVKIAGYVGERIDDCIEHRVKAQDVEHLVEPFRHRTEGGRWQSEFWGKWVQGAIASYRYNRDPELYEIIRRSVDGMISTQSPNGYIGNYKEEDQLKQWDVWGRKYTCLGLVAWYDLSGDKRALEAACRVLDHLMTQVGPTSQSKRGIASTGNYRGMASCSILEPVVYIYNRTKQAKYLDFAHHIASEMNSTDGGPELISKALADVPVAQRFPHPKTWFSRENGMKAYEMMSCYVGLLELYKITGKEEYLEATKRTVRSIIDTEINIAGSGAAFECWFGGKERQTLPAYHTMETCVTFTWMQICDRLLSLTGNALLADEIERTMYNALMASFKGDASQISKYSPLEGWRSPGEEQCGMHINCCNANGPRAFALVPQAMYRVVDNTILVNLYAQSEATMEVGQKRKTQVQLVQNTTYPEGQTIEIEVNPKRESNFQVALRIPAWCDLEHVSVEVNGLSEKVTMHGWHIITRDWRAGDKITLNLDMRGRVETLSHCQAVVRGPVVLARDSRFGDGYVDETLTISSKDGYVELKPVSKPDFAWMAFSVDAVQGTDMEGNGKPVPVKLCDFGSAGNTWSKSDRYRVWLPQTLNVMHTPYTPYNIP